MATTTTTTRPTESDARREIGALIAEFAAATGAKDPDRVMALFAPNDVQFILAPPLQYDRGHPWGRAALAAWFDTFDGPLTIDVRDPTIFAGGDVAFAHYLGCLSARSLQGEDFSLWHRMTLGLRRIDGRWRIAHVHQSVPFEMDGSFQAAVGLEP